MLNFGDFYFAEAINVPLILEQNNRVGFSLVKLYLNLLKQVNFAKFEVFDTSREIKSLNFSHVCRSRVEQRNKMDVKLNNTIL